MLGSYNIRVSSRRVTYEFNIHRNITVIRGDSATGKTTLVEMINNYNHFGEDAGIQLSCSCHCAVISGNDWRQQLAVITESIIFIDEGNRFITSEEFASVVASSNNYFVLITREYLPMLPYSAQEIYEMHTSGKYHTLHHCSSPTRTSSPESMLTTSSLAGNF